MQTITLVTGNPNKLKELQAIAPVELSFVNQRLDLDELQSLDLHYITEHKVSQAFGLVGGPVIIEDVSAGLESLNGLPGPFVKFFEQELGRGAMYELSKVKDDVITIRCTAAYFDGTKLLFGEGITKGTITEPRGSNGFGFDCCVIPNGETRTMAEMSADEKNNISHRGQAFRALLAQL